MVSASKPSDPNGPAPEKGQSGDREAAYEAALEDRRRRLVSAAAEILAERGYAALTVKDVTEAARISRAGFYATFDNKRDCILAAHREVFERLLRALLMACSTEREWPARVAAAISSLLAFAAETPAELRLLTLGVVATDTMIARQVADSNAHLAALLRDGRRHTRFGAALPPITEEAVVGGVASLLASRLPGGDLEQLEPEVMQLVLAPYVGLEEAARLVGRLRRPAGAEQGSSRPIAEVSEPSPELSSPAAAGPRRQRQG